MDIPLVSSLPLSNVGSAAAVAQTQAQVIESAAIVATPPTAPTTVDLSPLGQFLSATSLFQKKLLELQASASTVPEGQAFSDIAAATTTLAVAFNELLTSPIGGTDGNAEPLDQQSLAALFAQQFGAQTGAAGADQDTALASLGTVGLILNPNPALAPGQPLTVDLPLLQVALEVDPATTTTLLNRAGNAFAALVASGARPAAEIENSALSVPRTAGSAAAQPVPAASLLVEAQAPDLAPANPALTAESKAQAANQAAAADVARTHAEKDLADRALELAGNKRTQSGSEEERAALFDAIEEHDRVKADQLKADSKAVEQQRLQRANDARDHLNAEPAPALEPVPETVNAVPRNVQQEQDSVAAQEPPPVPLYTNAQQAARDPAIAAAIAAYNLNTGPFAALNVRQELAAPKLKTVPPVSSVTKVAPTDLV